MPRAPRGRIPVGCVVHIWFRFVDGRFLLKDDGRAEYLRRLDRALRESSDWTLLSYALMSTHIHLLFIAGLIPLGEWIKSVHVGFAQWINAQRRATHPKTLGHVLAERPHDKLIPTENAGRVIAYHHNNPPEAGVVACPSQSGWTSHRDYIGARQPIASLDVERGLELSGYADDPGGFHEFVLTRQGYKPGSASDDAALIIWRATQLSDTRVDSVRGGSKARPAVRARRVALAAWSKLGRSATSLSPHLGISASAAARLLKSAHPEIEADALRVFQDVFGAAWTGGSSRSGTVPKFTALGEEAEAHVREPSPSSRLGG